MISIRIKKYLTNLESGEQIKSYVRTRFVFLDPCAGESGAPLWITKRREISGDQNILVGVHSGGYKSGRYFQPVCSTMASRAHKMTDKVLAWIRINMERYDTNT